MGETESVALDLPLTLISPERDNQAGALNGVSPGGSLWALVFMHDDLPPLPPTPTFRAAPRVPAQPWR